MAFIDVDGITLYYVVEGKSDAPSLVFINSLGTDLRIWDEVVPRLADSFCIVRYDKRGHGLSDAPLAPYTIDDHAADLAGLLDRLHIRHVIPAGISVGGMIAMRFAAAWPERVSALVLSDTAPQIGTAEMWNERIGALRNQGLAYLADTILARWFAPSFGDSRSDAYRGYRNMLARMPVEGYAGTCEAIRDADLWAAAKRITAPTLVVCGAEDVATTPEQAQELTQAIPDARCEIIAGAAHLPCVEQPAAFSDALMTFLQEYDDG